jgi:hypothetical protein
MYPDANAMAAARPSSGQAEIPRAHSAIGTISRYSHFGPLPHQSLNRPAISRTLREFRQSRGERPLDVLGISSSPGHFLP